MVEIRVTAAIFEDGSTYGQEQLVDTFFSDRRRTRDALSEFVAVVTKSVADGGRSTRGLQLALERLESPLAVDVASPTRRMLLNNLRLAIDSEKRGLDSVDNRLRWLYEYAERHSAVVAAHLKRR